MSLSAGRYQLSNAFKALKAEWDATENIWRDVVRKDFADTYWDPLSVRLAALMTATDRLDQVMAQMKRDCE
jgi:hypothetical protein